MPQKIPLVLKIKADCLFSGNQGNWNEEMHAYSIRATQMKGCIEKKYEE